MRFNFKQCLRLLFITSFGHGGRGLDTNRATCAYLFGFLSPFPHLMCSSPIISTASFCLRWHLVALFVGLASVASPIYPV